MFVNNGPARAKVTCDDKCISQLPMPAASYKVKDVWGVSSSVLLRRDDRTSGYSYSAMVDGGGGSRMFELAPVR